MATQPPADAPLADDIRAHAAWLRRLAVNLVGSGALADDVVQDTWTAAIATPPARREALRPWLGQVLRNFVRLRARGEANRCSREAAAAALVAPQLPSSEELLARHEALSLLADEVRRLDEPTRSTILLCYAEGLAPGEIARRQGVPAGTVRSRLKRGLDQLRRQLDERNGDGSRAWCLALGLGVGTPVHPAPPSALVASFAKGALLMQVNGKTGMILVGLLLLLLGGVSLWRRGGGGATPPTDLGASAARVHERTRPRLGETAALTSAAAGAVEGTVRDGNGAPIENASVVVLAEGGGTGLDPVAAPGQSPAPAGRRVPGFQRLLASARSDASGRFRLAPLPAGSFRLSTAALGFLPGSLDGVTVANGQTVAGVEIRLARGGHPLSGRILDSGGGPIAKARLRVWIGGSGSSAALRMALWQGDEDGSYRLTLPPGKHVVEVEADGYAPARNLITLVGPQSQDFRLHPASTLTGQVIRRGTGAPVQGARVQTDHRGSIVVIESDAAGAFAFTNLEPGDYVVSAMAGALAGRSVRPVVVGLADRVEGIVIEIDTGRVISGRVLQRGGAPAPDVLVQLTEVAPFRGRLEAPGRSRRETRTGADGSYRLDAVLPGTFTVSAAAAGLARGTRRVAVAEVDVAGIDLELLPTAVVRGRVLDVAGSPAVNAKVRVVITGRGAEYFPFGPAVTDAEGRFRIEYVDPGAISVIAGLGEQGTTVLDAGTIAPGEEREVTLRLRGSGIFIRGRIVWDDGKPAVGLTVRTNSAAMWESGAVAVTDADGRYAVGPFGAGLLVFVGLEPASGWEGGRIESALGRPVRIPGADLNSSAGKDIEGIDFKLPESDARLAGVVLGPDGKPLAGTVVWTRPGRPGVRVVTGDDGRFEFEDLVRDKYVVYAEHAGLPPAQVADVPADTSNLRIRIESGGGLAGRVTRTSGSAPGPFTIWAQLAGGKPAAASFDRPQTAAAHQWVHSPEARFELRDLAPGTYDLVALTVEGDSGSLPGIVVKPGQQRGDLVVEVGAGAAVSGRLVDLDSRAPLGNVAGQAICEGRTRPGRTDAQGGFRFEGIARGVPCEVKFDPPGYMAFARGFTGPTDKAELELATLPVLPERLVGKHNGRVGMTIARDESGQIVVRNAPPESAAGKAGLKSGDVLLSIDRRNVHNADVGAVVMLVGGPPGAPLAVEARTGNEPVRQVRIVRM